MNVPSGLTAGEATQFPRRSVNEVLGALRDGLGGGRIVEDSRDRSLGQPQVGGQLSQGGGALGGWRGAVPFSFRCHAWRLPFGNAAGKIRPPTTATETLIQQQFT